MNQQQIQEGEPLAVSLQGFFPRGTREKRSLLSGQLQGKSLPCTGICVGDSADYKSFLGLGVMLSFPQSSNWRKKDGEKCLARNSLF